MKSLPLFSRNIEFRELTPKEGKYLYRYITLKDIRVVWTGLVEKGVQVVCSDVQGRIWLTIDSEGFTISKDYAWNGCSPKKYIPLFGWVGTIDFPKTILGSLCHDALVQFTKVRNFPLKRTQCDNVLRDILSLEGFEGSEIYYYGASIGTILDFGVFDNNLTVTLTSSSQTTK